VHRIIWCIFNASIQEDLVIDHIDGDPHNNRIENLMLKQQSKNMQNLKIRLSNKSGVTGVSLITKNKGKNKYFVACVTSNGKQRTKLFSADKHENAFELACEWRKEQIRLLNEQGAGYTDRHGM